MKKRNAGWTLVELMLTVGIMVTLSTVVAVKFGEMMDKAKEGATKGNVGLIMAAISVYYGETNGLFPDDITAEQFKIFLKKVPKVLVTHQNSGYQLLGSVNTVTTISVTAYSPIATNTDGWRYNRKTGNIWVNNSQTDLAGKSYSMYGYE
jgi:type II secretory pathway pseudopilin PulG